jgi:hypothetical protein
VQAVWALGKEAHQRPHISGAEHVPTQGGTYLVHEGAVAYDDESENGQSRKHCVCRSM